MNSIILTDKVKKSRDEVMSEMEQANIEMRPLFYPMHIMPVYRDTELKLPVAEKLAERGINLPSHSGLDGDKLEYIVDKLADIIKG